MPMKPPTALSVTASIRNCSQDVAPVRADRHADADLARPLRHAHEHDVHDPDAADDERDAGDRARAVRSSTSVVAVAASAISCWLRTVKSSSRAVANVVALAQERDDLLLRRREIVRVCRPATLMVRKRRAAGEALHRAGVTASTTTSSWSVPCGARPLVSARRRL